jgi:hypothetical protein
MSLQRETSASSGIAVRACEQCSWWCYSLQMPYTNSPSTRSVGRRGFGPGNSHTLEIILICILFIVLTFVVEAISSDGEITRRNQYKMIINITVNTEHFRIQSGMIVTLVVRVFSKEQTRGLSRRKRKDHCYSDVFESPDRTLSYK